jgi:hypothetical protein
MKFLFIPFRALVPVLIAATLAAVLFGPMHLFEIIRDQGVGAQLGVLLFVVLVHFVSGPAYSWQVRRIMSNRSSAALEDVLESLRNRPRLSQAIQLVSVSFPIIETQ